MANFPSGFVSEIDLLHDIGERGNAALERLQERGFLVATGLTEYFAGAIGQMATEPHIAANCPRDALPSRFASRVTTKQWLTKGGGRAVFLLLDRVAMDEHRPAGLRLAGYGWTGEESREELPEHPITSAYRIGQAYTGRGLAGDFVQAVVSGTNARFAPGEGIGLEAWKSNHAAGVYKKVGFVVRHERQDWRDMPRARVLDTKLFMGYPPKLLAE